MSCPKCSFRAPADFSFCPKCATALAGPVVAAERETQAMLSHAVERLIPKAFADRLQATRGQVGHERRMVTILFCDVKGSTAMAEQLDPEEVMDIMAGAFEFLIAPITRYEGTLARLMGDAVLAFFGAPLAHEDDPERAILAALEIVQGAGEYASRLAREQGIQGFNVRVGINTGLVVVGEVGSDLRVEYTAMGDAVNLAARMEKAAPPGGILITHDTYHHVRGVFDVQAQPPLLVRGRAEPVQTYVVQRAKPRAFRKPTRGVEGVETRMVGREAELKHLQEAFHTVMEDGELQVVTVTGGAGVGKSRLLYEFDNWAELLPEPFYYFKGRARHEMQNLPYSLIRDLVSFRLQVRDSDPPGVVREKLERGVAQALGSGEGSRRYAHTIGHLVGFALGDRLHPDGALEDAHAPEDAQQFRDQALSALADYFRGLAAQSPVLVLLEDLHWADDSSLDALNHLAQVLADEPLMAVCAARPALFERRPYWGEGQRFHSRLPLKPLSRWDSRRLVAEILLKVGEVPVGLRDLLVSGAEGNPFFLEELIRMLVDDGVLVTGEERWRLEPARLAEIRVPPRLTGVLQARVDRLSPEERTVLQQASVVGRLFWDRAVAHIHASSGEGVEAGEIADRLAALRRREMIYHRETSAFAGAEEYIFQHTLLCEITYEGVLKRLRRAYHGLVADWLLEQTGERAGEYTGLLADHLALAGRSEEAVPCLLQAGDRARRLYAHQEAIHAYERALALLKEMGDDDQAARTLMAMGLTYQSAFQFQQARQAYQEGFAMWQRASGMEPAIAPLPAPHPLRVCLQYPTTLDPTLTTDPRSGTLVAQLFCGLVERTPQMGIQPDVAQSWEVSEAGRRYVFRLRDDVCWSDGAPVTAGDFEFAWKRVLDPATRSPLASLLYDIAGARAFHCGECGKDEVAVRAVDGLTLVVDLDAPTGHFLQLLAHSSTYPVPAHTIQAYGESWSDAHKIVTNGPFRLASWSQEASMALAYNPEYHGRRRGNVRQIDLRFLPAGAWPARWQLYESDGLDILRLWDYPAHERERVRHRYPRDYVSGPVLRTTYIGFVTSRKPFDDARVRQAFVLALNRERMNDQVLGGDYTPATGGFIPVGMPGHSAGIGLAYDPEQARDLLAEAGYPSGRGFPVAELLSVPGAEPACEYLQTQWSQALGVEVCWEMLDFATLIHRVDRRPPHMFGLAWLADYPDPDSFMRASRIRHYTGWRNPTYDGLVESARRSADQAERMKLYAQADRILIEEAVLLPLNYGRNHLLVKPWVSRYPTSALGTLFWKDVVIEPH